MLLTAGCSAERLPVGGLRLFNLDEVDWSEAAECPAPPGGGATAESLAGLLYTSGPTGGPVGVCVSHRAIVRTVFDTRAVYLSAADRVAQVSGLPSGSAAFEMWGALLHGAALVITEANPSLSPRQFAAEVVEREVSVMVLPATLCNYLAGEVPRGFGTVRDLYVAGEHPDPRRVRELLRQGPPARLLHAYGLSECGALTTCETVAGVPDGGAPIPVGRPTANAQVYLLDEALRPVPPGVVGELYVGGDGVSRGYFNRPGLTAERFVPYPFNDRPGARLCKTGDLARYLPDGRIEFAGRVDRRTKMGGFRVEPREVEAALAEHPAVVEAAVLVRRSASGDRKLTAYLAPADEAEPPPGELRRFLRGKLPDYMLPSDFIMLSSLPRAADGRLDAAALPPPETERPPLEESFVAPRTPAEKELARIWSQVFGLAKVGVRDNFFHMGGHSLLATQVTSRARDAFGVELPVRRLFESPTIEGLAKYIETARGAQPEPELRAARGEAEQALEHLAELSEEQVDSLLSRMLQEETAAPAAPVAPNAITRRREDELLSKLDELPADEVNSLLSQLLAEETGT